MSVRNTIRPLLGMAAASLLLGSLPATATETICTHITQAAENPIPMDEREGNRQVQGRVLPGFVAEGDKLLAEGKEAAAMNAYARVFAGYFYYKSVLFDAGRCLPMDFYQAAADKFRAVASAVAQERSVRGHLLDAPNDRDGESRAGALELYLHSNQYDVFIERAFQYAESELLKRDIDYALTALVGARLDQLENVQSAGAGLGTRGRVNDLTPLLDEELIVFTKLSRFDERLAAHLSPLYPKITDHWLAEEAKNHDDAIKTDGKIPKRLMFGRATDALQQGIKRLYERPEEVARLHARADARGRALMTREQYQPAAEYFEVAGNEALAAKARRLAEAEQLAWAGKLEASLRSDVEKMKMSEEEQAVFQDEADEMAAEFGFDLEE